MPIKEQSFRIGCGRYTQGQGILAACGSEIQRLGNAPLIIGGATALSLTRKTIEESLSAVCNKYEIVPHTGTCNEQRAKELAELAAREGYDVIVGIGGGVLCDFAKLCGYFAKRPVINIPTSSATCAAYTPLSVRYTPEGRTVGSLHYPYEVDAVIVDTAIVGRQPVRLFLAGVFDSLAKFIEIKQRFDENTAAYPIGLDWAYIMSQYSYKQLCEKTGSCLGAMEAGEITEDLENVLFTLIAATGVISGIARGSNQCALAHKFYESTRSLFHETARPYLHGEIVGVGLLLQNYFNGEPENNAMLLELMKKHNMPYRVTDIGITKDDRTRSAYYEKLCNSSAIDKTSAEECARLDAALQYLWAL